MSYLFLDHTADIAVLVIADNLENLFISAASAWRDVVVDGTAGKDQERSAGLQESTLEELLVSFLDELNYLLLSKHWVFHSVKSISLRTDQGFWNLDCLISGEELDTSHHVIKEEIKAVTFHQMYIQNINEQYMTKIIFDV